MTIYIEVSGYSYEGPALHEFGGSEMRLPAKRRELEDLTEELFRRLHDTQTRLAAAEEALTHISEYGNQDQNETAMRWLTLYGTSLMLQR